jgi:flagellar FliL protein
MSDAASSKNAPAPKKGGRTLLIAAIAGAVLLAGGGAGAYFVMKGEPDAEAAAARAEARRKAARVFVTLEPFVVNLADRESERYAQVGVVLEVEGKEVEKTLSAKMPAVRNEILLLISSKLADELTTRDGKQTLASEIAVASARPLGWTPPDAVSEQEAPPAEAKGKGKGKAQGKDATATAKATPKQALEPPPNPVAGVHFASFIVQ